jgi:NifU-like protein involved in Fe-S cluster formation
MEFWLMVRSGRVELTTFTTGGCGSSLAAGQTVEKAEGLRQQDILEALGGCPARSSTERCWLALP